MNHSLYSPSTAYNLFKIPNTPRFSLNASAVALGEEFVVVGSRTVRTAIETPAPVDVFSELEIRQSGQTEINQTLRQLALLLQTFHTCSKRLIQFPPNSLVISSALYPRLASASAKLGNSAGLSIPFG